MTLHKNKKACTKSRSCLCRWWTSHAVVQFELTTIIYTLKIQSSLKQIPHF